MQLRSLVLARRHRLGLSADLTDLARSCVELRYVNSEQTETDTFFVDWPVLCIQK
jgi:hypothetical protein